MAGQQHLSQAPRAPVMRNQVPRNRRFRRRFVVEVTSEYWYPDSDIRSAFRGGLWDMETTDGRSVEFTYSRVVRFVEI